MESWAPLRITLIALMALAASLSVSSAAELPPVKATDRNKVPSCVTPGRLMAFLQERNEKLDPRFDAIATEYMRHGEDLSLRWDIAFFQMILETGNLTFTGDVKPKQNNFAGLGATGNGEPGESFKDVTTGVRAHLEHLVMYTGQRVENPVAERTRKVQEWGVLTDWQKSIKGPITFAQLARKWAPPARKYAADIAAVTDSFMDGACKQADPRPELVMAARKSLLDEALKASASTAAAASAAPAAGASPVSDVAKRAVEAAKAGGDGRSALGAAGATKPVPVPGAPVQGSPGQGTQGVGVLPQPSTPAPPQAKPGQDVAAVTPRIPTVINSQKPDEAPAADAPPATPQVTKTAAPVAAGLKPGKPAAEAKAGESKPGDSKPSDKAEPRKCNVFTASYGGQKSVIIKVVGADTVNYTVLDVNEGAEARETDAYIAAYAKGGKLVGDFKSQALALDKAFELCPEG